VGEATAYNAIGWHLAHLDRPEPALAHCRRALTIFTDLADAGGQAMTLDSIGLALEMLDRPAEAQDHYQRSAQLDAELGWHVARAETLGRLERCYLRTGQPAAARLARDDADDTLRQTGRLAA
jgi:tetratricopeptide (TPR) repeat protein